MKKTSCIHLALITAALSSCSKPAYWRTPEDPDSADRAPSYGDSCVYDPAVDMWRYSFQHFIDDYFYYYSLPGYHSAETASGNITTMRRPAVVRGGFGKTLAVVS
ncbi:MAG TPA: hypothetical protein VKR53_14105 [Puia sp.]|nr:hypothetical protein [Puia sp.]